MAQISQIYTAGCSKTPEFMEYFIEPISNVPHIKTVLGTLFVQFVISLLNCKKLCILLLVNLSKYLPISF